jgi:hypothetical protein
MLPIPATIPSEKYIGTNDYISVRTGIYSVLNGGTHYLVIRETPISVALKAEKEVKNMNRQIINTAVGILFLIGSASAAVCAMDGPPDSGRQMGPPPEAVEACKDKNEGDKVEITNPRGEKMDSVCEQIDGKLVAVPEGGFR